MKKSYAIGVMAALVVLPSIAYFFRYSEVRDQQAFDNASQRNDELIRNAVQDHPEMLAEQARTAAAIKESNRIMEGQSVQKQRQMAADVFLGYYFKSVDGFAGYCLKQGIDMKAFVASFQSTHSDAYKMARALEEETDKIRKKLVSRANELARLSIEGAAAHYQLTPAEMCKAIDKDPAELVAHASVVFPEAYALLMNNDPAPLPAKSE